MELVKVLGKVLPLLKPVLPYVTPLLHQLLPYEIRVRQLVRDVNKLQKVRNRVYFKVKEEENRNERAIDNAVIKWLSDADDILFYYENFCEDEERPYAVYSDGYLPKPAIRYHLGRIVNEIVRRVNVLLQRTKNDDFSYWLGPPSFGADFDNIRFEMFESRNQTMADIMAALGDSNVGMIGVYGQGGIGKTSLIKEVAKKVKLKGNMFDVVIMVNITSRPDIRSIQGQIAEKLGMKLEEESESGRATQLQERLKDPKEKTLIILDNMGVKLDFSMLGIPSENNDDSQMSHKMKKPSVHHSYAMKTEEFDASSSMKIVEPLANKGCKILMISKSEQLLLSQTHGRTIQTFCVKPLTEKEAEKMFKTMSEIDNENSTVKILAAQIAKKCKGLPMTIVTTAKALKHKSLPVWEEAYQNLERKNFTAVQEFSTMLSYGLLENEELKHTLLICARLDHDALITDLVRYCIGMGILQRVYTVREARERVHALVGELKELNLLSDSFSSDRFTMQDVIRDAVLSIATQQMHAFVPAKGKLDEWPDEDKLRSYSAIFLQHCDVTDIIEEFPKGINYSRLRVFHLDNKDARLRIPDEIFDGMKELRVLILTGIHLSPIPSSIKCLTKLRMLCLERCKLGENFSIIGELKRLRVLNLSGSDIECLPVEVSHLAKLQIFDISNCFKLKEIPADVLSSLTSLEELYVGNSSIQWRDEEGQGNQRSGNAGLSQLRLLNQLTTLDIQIPNIKYLPQNLSFDKLDSYKIIIRDFNADPVWDFKMLEMCEASRNLALQLEEGLNIHHQKEIKILFARVENLLLGQLNDVEDIFYELNYEGFPYLKYLSIVSNSKVKSIINSNDQNHHEKAFPKLESLFLYEVINMEHICHSPLTNDSFCKLKIIRLKMCGQLKNVFFSSMIKHLCALETIEVSDCSSLEEIVTSERDNSRNKIKFPELRSLILQSLSEFIGFYIDDSSTGEQVPNRKPNELFDEKVEISKLERMDLSSIKIQKIWNDQPPTRLHFQNLMHLDVNDCWNLSYLLSLSMSKSLMNLQSLFVSKCGMMKSIFKETEFSMIDIEESIFPKLKNINLRSMKRLKEMWHPKFPLRSFGKLDALIIDRCDELKNVFPSYMVGRFQSLCSLRVTNCKSMNEIFDLKNCIQRVAEDMTNLQGVHIEALPQLEHVWNIDPKGILNFNNLKKIWVRECLNLKHIFPISIAMVALKELEFLEVWNCGQLKEIVSKGETINVSSISFDLPELTTARFSKLPNLVSFYGETHELCCSALNNLSVELCEKLKLFRKENAIPQIKPIFLLEKVIYNLKSMQVEPHDADLLRTYIGNYRMHRLEEFQLSRLLNTEILYFFLHRNPNLKSLVLSHCFFEQLVPPRGHDEKKTGVVPKLKSLKLVSLPSLKIVGFEEDATLFERLEFLILKECPCLNTIAASSVSFTYLTNLEVSNCDKLSHLMTPMTAKSLVQLTTMKVIQCESMETIVSKQENKEGIIFRQLKEIELVDLHKLESFCSSNGCEFEFPSLEKFVLSACGNMKNFSSSDQVNKTPSLREICVTHEKEEKRYYWKGDLNATIQHMHKISAFDLDKMAASHLNNSLKRYQLDYVAHAFPTAVFPSLKNLEELEELSIVQAFDLNKMAPSLHNKSLERYQLDYEAHATPTAVFPSLKNSKELEELSIVQALDKMAASDCNKLLETYQLDYEKEATSAAVFPSLKNSEELEELSIVQALDKMAASHRNKLLETYQLDYEEEATSTAVFPSLKNSEELEELNIVQVLDPGKMVASLPYKPFESSRLLKTLKLANCELGSHAIPTVVFSSLKSLEELDVFKADVKVIFANSGMKGYTFPLKKLTLDELPNLIQVWDKDSEGILSFQNLQEVVVTNCKNLATLFPMELAKKVEKLEKLEIRECGMVQTIVEEENATTEATEEFSFPRLTTLNLCKLPQLTCFHPGRFTLECPELNHLEVLLCNNLETFQSQQDEQGSTSVNKQHLFSEEKAVFILESLKLDWKNTTMLIRNRKFLEDTLHKLTELELDFEDDLEGSNFPIEVLEKTSSLEYLQINKCIELEELFPSQPKQVELRMHGHTKTLSFVCRELQKLFVSWCPSLTTFEHSAVSFSNLKQLSVSNCGGLKYLFTSSTARMLVHLEEMYIVQCESMEEILAKELEETSSEAIKFERLNTIILDSLSSLVCFCSGSDTLLLSSLTKVLVWKCPNMKIFSRGVVDAESFLGIQVSLDPKEDLLFHQNVNAAVKGMFQPQEFFEAMDKECFSDILELKADWHDKVGEQSKWLSNLVTLKLNCCTLPYAIPSSILPYLKNLKELEVRHSEKVEVIFDMNDGEIMETTSQLKKLTLRQLFHLTHVWEKNSPGVLIFQNLQEVVVSDCRNLQSLFPASLAKNLDKLEKLQIGFCYNLQEIVEKELDTEANVTEKFVFPHLKVLDLRDLPQVTYFYPQIFTLECPSLNSLSVSVCGSLELFQSTSINRQSLLSNINVIPNLKELRLDGIHIWALSLRFRSGQFVEGLKYLEKISLNLYTYVNEMSMPIEILQKAPNLIEMKINHCNSPEIFQGENGKPGQLHESNKSEDSSWSNTICEKLQILKVERCPHLATLKHSTSTVSFSCLKKLFIFSCPKLQYLFTSSSAKQLMNLEEITVGDCRSVKEIVAKEGDATSEAFEFERLHTIVLHYLPSLICFYSGSDTLQLSSLKEVHIWSCPNMKYFSQGLIFAELFPGIQVFPWYAEEPLLFNQDINATISGMFQRQEFFKALQVEWFSDDLELQADRHGNIDQQNNWLCNLVTLKLDNCTLPYAIPSAILLHLTSLKELEMLDNDKVEVIFDMNDAGILETTSQLKILTLKGLSKLKHVWDKNSQGGVIFRNLQEVIVSDCGNLQTLFPASLAKNLTELEKLDIESCHNLREIVEREEGIAANVIEKFVFPHLEKLSLRSLPQLPQTFTLECPVLNDLSVLHCDKLELFQSELPNGEGESTGTSVNTQSLFSILEVISNLKELRLGWKHILALSKRFRSGQFVQDLKNLNKISLFFDADENEKLLLPIEILQKAPNLIELSINTCSSPEIFLAEHPKIGEDGMLGQLIMLTLCKVSMLHSIESKESSWLNTICEKLSVLNVYESPHLTTLVHSTSTLSFSCLKQVCISKCANLEYLFTSSALKKLMNLEKITVKECGSVKEIVAKEGDATSEAIKFKRLNTIVLHSLPSLISFYLGSATLQLSSLINVFIWQCPDMKIFSQGLIDAESFRGIQLSLDPHDDLLFLQDLNTTVRGMWQRQEFLKAVDKRCFTDNLELQADCHGKVGLQNKWLCNLVTLKLNNCTLPYAIPSAILPRLKSLKKLEVRDSDKVEAIFDMNDTEILETTSQLKILTLKGLSKLTHVWKKNSPGVLIFQNLQEVVVSDCGNLQTLFPASLAKNLMELENLEIECCRKLQEIVENEEGTAANITEKFVFPRLESLCLFDLPQCTCFYPQTFILECPSLNGLYVKGCHKFELFQSAHPTSEGEGRGTSINRQPLISNLKVISIMKDLMLDWKHILALHIRFESEQLAEGLKDLKKISLLFGTDENEKPMLPIEILQKAPNLIFLGIGYCKSPGIFLAEDPKIGEEGMLGQLKTLLIHDVSMLQSIMLEGSSWLNTICETLHKLDVDCCHHLTTLVHSTSTVSFSCLKKLSISNCPNLQYLFTSSAAKKLMNLEKITVKQCESVTEIVAKVGDEDENKGEDEDKYENEMIFGKLEILTLDSLPKFERFYTGISTLNFPSLKKVTVTKCCSTKLLSLGDKVPAILKVIIDGADWEGDINSVTMQLFKEAA